MVPVLATYAYTFDGAWFDIGTLESYLDAVAWHLGDDSLISDTASVADAMIGRAVHVMTNATLVNTASTAR